MRNRLDFVPATFALAIALGMAANAAAQNLTPVVEAGGYVSGLASRFSPATIGIGTRISVPVAPHAAIEGRVTLFPRHREPVFLAQGGETIELQAGARGSFLVRRRFSVYGMLLPGLIHFTDAITSINSDEIGLGSVTHFALDMGLGVEFHPGTRWHAYAEYSGPLFAIRGAELGRSDPSASGATLIAELPASVQSTGQFNAGLSYRIGGRPEQPAEAPRDHARWIAGAQAGHTTYAADFGGLSLMQSATIGTFASAGITRWLDADGAFDVLLRREKVHSPAGGGRVLQALAGVKAGRRATRLGYFARLRAGVRTRDASVLSPYTPGQRPVIGRSTTSVLDYGAAIEAYAGRRIVMRVDAGDIVSFSGYDSGESLNVTAGLGWRFGT
jgi:hypothetical protein